MGVGEIEVERKLPLFCPARMFGATTEVIVERGQIAPHQYEVQVSNSSLGSFGTGRSGLKFAIR